MSDHLTVTKTDRGFDHMPPVPSEYGGEVRVYESSAASGPHVWLSATCPMNLNEPNGPSVSAVAHLTAENAWRVAEQLWYLARDHYQGDATPAWVGSSMREALRLIAGECENYTTGDCRGQEVKLDAGGYGPRRPDAGVTAERWCNPCIARAGLDGQLKSRSAGGSP